MPYLTKAQIVEAQALRTDAVDVPEWGEGAQVRVRELTTAEILALVREIFAGSGQAMPTDRDEVAAMLADGDLDLAALVDLFPQVVAWCVVDEDLEPILSLEDVERFAGRSFNVIQRIAERALELSDFGEGDHPASKNA